MILILFLVSSCSQTDTIVKENFVLPLKNYYLFQTKDIKSVDDVIIDSIVPITERKQLEDSIASNEKRFYFFVEAKDDEYADSTAIEIKRMKQKLETAENKSILYYSVYHTVKFSGNDQVRRKRQSQLNITHDYKIRPNAVTEMDKLTGVKGEELYKPYKY
jgi:hypothetical protein